MNVAPRDEPARPGRTARILRAAGVAAVAAAGLAGCVVAPPRPVVVRPLPVAPPPAPVYDGGYVVDVPPPAPYVEVVPAVPYAGAVWIGGYWGWRGNRHQWVPGHYDAPRPGYGWRPHAWVPEGGRWHFREGGWVRR